VLVPTPTHADTLRYALASVQRQTCQDFEVPVVDDGAPARTAELFGALAARDARIH